MEGKGVIFQGRRAAASLIVFVFTAIFPQLPALAASVTVQWDPSPDPNVTGYNFYYGVASRTYTNVINVGNTMTVTVSNLVEGTTYYFAATAYNLLGIESVFSDELSYTVPLPGNNPPTLNTIGSLTLNEDAAAQTVNLSGISSGSATENQTLVITATSSNPGLIPNPTVNYTSLNTTGTLSFTPAANATGTATITVTVNDGQAQNNTFSRTFTVTVNPVNDSPTLNNIGNLTINEDAAAQTVNLAGIGSGAANESQTLTVTATSSNPGLIPNPPVSYTSPNSTGSLAFAPVANANGTATITVTVNDGQAQNNTFSRTFTVTVNAVNDAPTLNALANVGISENVGLQTVSLAGISTGAANETQSLTVAATSSNPGLIPNPTVNYTSPNATGSLAFTPAANASGTATITVTVNDGQAQNNTVTRTFTVTVDQFVNTPPTLSALSNRTINEDAAAQTVNLSGISSGSASETQTLTVTATSSNPGLIPNPTVSYTSPNTSGTLSFTPVADANGTVTITVMVNDGQAQNNTFSRTFTVTVNAVNDAPALNNIGNLTISEDAAAQTVNLAGLSSGAANEAQTLTVTATSSNPGLIPNPAVSYTTPNSAGSLAFTPVAEASGTATITVTVNDGQPQNGTVTRTFTVTVNAVNDPPRLDSLVNSTLDENAGLQTVALSGIGSGAANEIQTLAVTATSSNPALIPNPTVNYISPNTTGALGFTPVADASGTATITVTVNDGQTQNNTVSRTFTVTVNAANRLPIISAITNVIIAQDTATPAIPFTIGDVETAAPNLELYASSSNPLIVLDSGIVFGGSGTDRTVTITPLSDRGGETEITITVSDGEATASTTFLMTVLGPPAPPASLTIVTNGTGTVSGIPTSQTFTEGQVYTLTATGGEGQMFTGWTGSTNTKSARLVVKARSNLVVQANFIPLKLTTNGSGTITPDLRKTKNLVPGKIYSVTAAGSPGNMFVGWSGSINWAQPRLSFLLYTNANLQANFAPANLTVSGNGTISPDLRTARNLVHGKVYTLTARPGPGQEFAGWSGSTNSDSPTLKVVLDTNLALQATFVPSPYLPIAGSYSGLFYEQDEVRPSTSGFFSVNVTTRGTYSGMLLTGSSRQSFSGKLKLDLNATNLITRRLYAPLTLELSFGTGDQIDQVTGRLSEANNWVSDLTGDRVIFNARTNPAPYAGNYTLVLPGQVGNALVPEGDGYGTLRITTAGRATFTGILSDGARVTQSASLSKNGHWPLYSGLRYGIGRGALLGWMNFEDRPNDDLHGTVSWIKDPTAMDKFYPLGFDIESQAVGSIYLKPVSPQTNYVLNLTEAEVSFSGGNLAPDFINSILIGANSRVSNLSSNRMTLTFSTAQGTYSGSVVDPTTSKSFTFKGAVLQKQNAGFGLLTGTNQTSRVVIAQP